MLLRISQILSKTREFFHKILQILLIFPNLETSKMRIANTQERCQRREALITPPARRAWRSYKFVSLDFSGFFSVSEFGLPLMGDTAGTKLHEPI